LKLSASGLLLFVPGDLPRMRPSQAGSQSYSWWASQPFGLWGFAQTLVVSRKTS
jgi:hypothetical protein